MNTATAAGTDDRSDPRPYVRLAALLRTGITGGAIPPGTRMSPATLASEHGVGIQTAAKALGVLEDAGLITRHNGRRYAAPAGPPSPRTAARLGAALAALRETAGLSPAALAAQAGLSREIICSAESGTWHARSFWHACDTALNAGGTLLKLHDTLYVPARPGEDDEHHERQRHHPRVPCYVPGPAAQPATARTLAAIILIWDDGTRTTALIPYSTRGP